MVCTAERGGAWAVVLLTATACGRLGFEGGRADASGTGTHHLLYGTPTTRAELRVREEWRARSSPDPDAPSAVTSFHIATGPIP